MATTILEIATADSGNTPNTSGSFTPVLGDLLVVFVVVSESVSVTVPLTSSTGMTFTQFLRATYRTSLDSIYGFVSDTLVTNVAAQTVTFTPADPGSGTVISVFAIAGMKRVGLNAIRQFAKQDNQAAAGTPAPAFSLAALTANVVLGLIGNSTSPAGLTPPASWTEPAGGDTGYSTPTTGSEVAFRNSGETGTTITWGSTSASAFASMIVELNTSEKDPYKPEMQRGPILAQ